MTPPREADVALWSRLYAVLSERPEYLRADHEERFQRTEAALCLGEVERELIEQSSELDRFCGYAVTVLRRDGARAAELIDVLGALDQDRLAALALALPEGRRRAIVRRDPVWARALRDLDMEKIAAVERVADGIDALSKKADDGIRQTLGHEIADEVERVADGERRLYAGLPHDLSLDELIDLYERKAESADQTSAAFAEARRRRLEVVA